MCESCSFGHMLQNNRCHENVCNCQNGIGATNTDCQTDSENSCDSCYFGYYLNDHQCLENVCECTNGIGSININCPEHGDEYCWKCDYGYNIQNDLCVENECVCDNGVGSTGEECETHEYSHCGGCNFGFHLQNVTIQERGTVGCVGNYCYCDNGVPGYNLQCETHGDHSCVDCDVGYNLRNGLCVENVCACSNGVGTTNSDCPTNASEFCEMCNFGYHMSANKCFQNICTCENGQGAVNVYCEFPETEVCASCDSGYNLQSDDCVPNSCVCDNGVGAVAESCVVNGDAQCEYCDSGYTIYFDSDTNRIECILDSNHACLNRNMDIVFLLDGTKSISAGDFQKSIQFSKDMVEYFEFGMDNTRAALVQFGTTQRTEFGFTASKSEILSNFGQVNQIMGMTFTGRGITLAKTISDNTGRGNADQIIVLITDGASMDNLIGPADDFKESGGVIFVVGYGDDVPKMQQQVRATASDRGDGSKLMWTDVDLLVNEFHAKDLATQIAVEMCEMDGGLVRRASIAAIEFREGIFFK